MAELRAVRTESASGSSIWAPAWAGKDQGAAPNASSASARRRPITPAGGRQEGQHLACRHLRGRGVAAVLVLELAFLQAAVRNHHAVRHADQFPVGEHGAGALAPVVEHHVDAGRHIGQMMRAHHGPARRPPHGRRHADLVANPLHRPAGALVEEGKPAWLLEPRGRAADGWPTSMPRSIASRPWPSGDRSPSTMLRRPPRHRPGRSRPSSRPRPSPRPRAGTQSAMVADSAVGDDAHRVEPDRPR